MFKRITTILISFLLLTASAHAGGKVGASLAYGNADSSGTITEGSTETAKSGDDNSPLVQFFAEAQVEDSPFSIGIAFMPLSEIADVDGTVTDATIKITKHFTLYGKLEGEFPLGGLVFAKAGISRGDLKVDSLTTTSGDGLIDNVDTLMGHTVGLGYERDLGTDAFIRAEVNYTSYDDVTGTSNNLAGNDTAKTFKADLDLTMFMISVGKKF